MYKNQITFENTFAESIEQDTAKFEEKVWFVFVVTEN